MMKAGRVSIIAIGFSLVMFLSLGNAVGIKGQEPNGARPSHVTLDTMCAGFISDLPMNSGIRIVGAGKELQSYPFAERDLVYVNKGVEQGITPGTVYMIVRPFGGIKQPFTKQMLGYYVKQLGLARIETVQGLTSKAKITAACDEVWLGDLLVPYDPPEDTHASEVRTAATKPVDDIVPDAAAPKGQIFFARGFREYLGTNDIVFVDLGSAKGVQPGDSFTIYRTIGATEGLLPFPDNGIQSDREGGYSGERYRGGDYSNDAPPVQRDKMRKNRPTLPRKVVGQLVLIRVDKTASVARIVQSNEEINVGDSVQLNSH
jgi:hypothetical protein